MIKCNLCRSTDIVRVTLKENKKRLAVCKECYSVYEVDKSGIPIFSHNPCDEKYFKDLENEFSSWDEVENIENYNA